MFVSKKKKEIFSLYFCHLNILLHLKNARTFLEMGLYYVFWVDFCLVFQFCVPVSCVLVSFTGYSWFY